MIDRSVNGLRACIASLEKVVHPVVEDAGDSLASEQVALMKKYLSFLASRIDHINARERFELHRYVDMGRAILGVLAVYNISETTLSAAIERADSCLEDCDANLDEFNEAGLCLRAELSSLTRGIKNADIDIRRRVEKVIHEHSKTIIDMRRSWYKPLDWEENPAAIPELARFLGNPGSRQ